MLECDEPELPAGNDTLGIVRFVEEDVGDQTTLRGLDASGNEVARLDLVHGRFAVTPPFTDDYDTPEVDGRKLNVHALGQRLHWETAGFEPVLKMPAHPSSQWALAAFLADPHAKGILDRWQIGFEKFEALADGEVGYLAGSFRGDSPQTCNGLTTCGTAFYRNDQHVRRRRCRDPSRSPDAADRYQLRPLYGTDECRGPCRAVLPVDDGHLGHAVVCRKSVPDDEQQQHVVRHSHDRRLQRRVPSIPPTRRKRAPSRRVPPSAAAAASACTRWTGRLLSYTYVKSSNRRQVGSASMLPSRPTATRSRSQATTVGRALFTSSSTREGSGPSKPGSRTLVSVSSATHLAISDDGNTLAVGAPYESSNATGINGNQSDTRRPIGPAQPTCATRSGTTWTQQAYVKASTNGRGR